MVAVCGQFLFGFTLTATDLGGGKLQIGYQVGQSGDFPSALALRVQLLSGHAFLSYPSGVVSVSNHFPTYLDYAYEVSPISSSAYKVGDGHPLANQFAAGTDYWAPDGGFSICMAAPPLNLMDFENFANDWLYADFSLVYPSPSDINLDGIVDLGDYVFMADPGWSGSLVNLVTLQFDVTELSTISISPDSLRGGILGDYGTIGTQGITVQLIPEPATLAILGLGGLALLRRRK